MKILKIKSKKNLESKERDRWWQRGKNRWKIARKWKVYLNQKGIQEGKSQYAEIWGALRDQQMPLEFETKIPQKRDEERERDET